jgi:preprotein translocase subunit SecE
MATLIKNKTPLVQAAGAAAAVGAGDKSSSGQSQISRREPDDEPTETDGGSSGGPSRPRPPTTDTGGNGGFFHIYKKGQGYWTRMGPVGGAALIGALTLQFLFSERATFRLSDDGGVILCVIFAVAYTAFAFFMLNRPRHVDFLIATDSEMKKVNWTSRQELIGSTKVVILFMFIIAAFLFVMDIAFGYLFWFVGVLKEPPF